MLLLENPELNMIKIRHHRPAKCNAAAAADDEMKLQQLRLQTDAAQQQAKRAIDQFKEQVPASTTALAQALRHIAERLRETG